MLLILMPSLRVKPHNLSYQICGRLQA